MPPPPFTSSEGSHQIPDTPLDLALLLTALRRMILVWRERAGAAPEREARIYRQAEADLSSVISNHPETSGVWSAAKLDIVQTLLEALDERARRAP